MSGFVYAIGGDFGPVKVGWTATTAEQRIKSLQTGNPIELRVLACREGSMREEGDSHERLHPHWIRGEWFERGPALAEFGKYEPPWPGNHSPEEMASLAGLCRSLDVNRRVELRQEGFDKGWSAADGAATRSEAQNAALRSHIESLQRERNELLLRVHRAEELLEQHRRYELSAA